MRPGPHSCQLLFVWRWNPRRWATTKAVTANRRALRRLGHYGLVASQVPVRGMFWLQETADHVPDIELPSRVPVKDTGTPERTQPMVTLDPSSVRSTVPVGQSVFVLSIGPL